uniref:UDENN domain-containing protein n=1 Tax=Parastrongyloides trichosuri TaxID=131310 RepID=A0A0N4Z9I4_PARTI
MLESCRLADYFAVITYDEVLPEYCSDGNFKGVEVRFPKDNWPDVQYPNGLENFSLPFARSYTVEKMKPSFFVCTLTDEIGNSQYACCLVTQEKVKETKLSQTLNFNTSRQSTFLLKPKIYAILSRIPSFDFFRNFLNHVYKALCDKSNNIEKIIAALLSNNIVYFGKQSKINLSFGGIDLPFHVPRCFTWPDTGKRIYTLISNLGTIYNILEVFTNVLNEKRIIFCSKSLNRLSDACYALKCLLYPFNYSYPYIPVLPKVALTVLESPTPYIVGLHSSLIDYVVDIQDYCLVNLDDGQIITDKTTSNKPIPEPYFSKLKIMLEYTWSPSLQYADDALQEGSPPIAGPKCLDIKIRACFLKFFLDILYGYRSCLQLSRFYDTPLVSFHKTAFLGIRQLDDSKFMHDLVASPMFQGFINDRGIPYRLNDLFDRLVTEIRPTSKNDVLNNECILKELNFIITQLSDDRFEEYSSSLASLITCPYFKTNVYDTVEINPQLVDTEIKENMKRKSRCEFYSEGIYKKEIVPQVCALRIFDETKQANSRKIEVLKSCLNHIFEGRLSDARKLMSTVELSLRTVSTRVSLCQLLWINLQPINKATMTSQQFDLVMKLLNIALECEGSDDEHGIAYAVLYLGNVYCRKLSSGIHQFAYTCLQNHSVWKNQKFWEIAFFHDVHQQLRRFYIAKEEELSSSGNDILKYDENEISCPYSLHNCLDTWNLFEKPTAMDVMASRIRRNLKLTEEEIEQFKKEEESIIFGQAKHYINLMTYMRVPLSMSKGNQSDKNDKVSYNNENGNYETGESNGSSSGSVYEENEVNENCTIKWITTMIDRICSMAGLSQSSIDKLEQDIPAFVALHIESLEQVYAESKRTTTSHEMKNLEPSLVQNEIKINDGLRTYLFNDHRFFASSFGCDNTSSDDNLIALPADGALFLTNYRLIFKGYSCNPLRYGEVVQCSIPLISISSEKTLTEDAIYNEAINSNLSSKIASKLHSGTVITSNSFNIIKIAFQESVTKDCVENFIQKLNNYRWGAQIVKTLFAYQTVADYVFYDDKNNVSKSKFNNLKLLRKNFVKGTKKMTGLEKRKTAAQTTPYSERSSISSFSGKTLTIAKGGFALNNTSNGTYDEYLDFNYTNKEQVKTFADMAKGGIQYHYLLDYERLFPNNISRSFEISFINSNYEVVKSYPAFLCLPSNLSSYSIAKIAKNFKSNRFPVITWKSSKGSFLIRGSSFTAFNVVSKITKGSNFFTNVINTKNRTTEGSGQMMIDYPEEDNDSKNSGQSLATLTSATSSSGVDILFEYIYILMKISNSGHLQNSNTTSPSTCLRMTGDYRLPNGDLNSTLKAVKQTKRISGYVNFTKHASNFIKMSTGKKISKNNLSEKSSLNINGDNFKYAQFNSQNDLLRYSIVNEDQTSTLISPKHAFYILGERSQTKAFKIQRNYEFIPINYPTTHDVKYSFKKFLKIMTKSQNGNNIIQCNTSIPSTTNLPDTLYNLHFNYFSNINDSEWMVHISNLINISNTISDLINEFNASVALCIEDGSDATCQISSIVQIMLDPFYRTFIGFRLLVEKEWLAFGHRFSYRLNHSSAAKQSGVAPMFLLFLDVVHQLAIQFPTAFEMNDYYFRFLAYHSMSAYYPNFLLDSEYERVSIEEKIPEEKLNSDVYERSIWNHLENMIEESNLFRNITFDKNSHTLLKPLSTIENLDIWSFYQERYLNQEFKMKSSTIMNSITFLVVIVIIFASMSYGQMTFSDGWGKRSSNSVPSTGVNKEKVNVNRELESYVNNKCMVQYTNDVNRILSLMTESYSQYELCKQQLR